MISATPLRYTFALTLFTAGLHAQTLSDRLDKVLARSWFKDGPGVNAMLIRDGQVAYNKSFGLAEIDARTAVTADTQFLLGSVTKQFTAMSIMILEQRGKLQFEDPLSKFCPEFPAYARTIRSGIF